MNVKDIFINFFISKGHKQIPSSPIIPENDPTCLFNTAGMQPLVPYLMGETHPLGNRLCDFQKCFRLTDLDGIGDKTHHTFFEMLGNWSLGDYFKEESITWSFELLTKHFNIPLNKLAVTVFRGNDVVKKDMESANIWKSLGIKDERIAYLDESNNWWGPASTTGPCGPDTEIFYFRSNEDVPKIFNPDDERWVEIWNNVFMEYNKDEKGNFIPLKNKNVDTGMGVERITAVLENVLDNYKTSIFIDVIEKIEELSNKSYDDLEYTKSMRIIADHLRAIVIIAGDNASIKPSNTDQGYILRRLIRRSIRYAKKLELKDNWESIIALMFITKYKDYYSELEKNQDAILEILSNEKIKFNRTLEKGLREFEKLVNNNISEIDDVTAFKLYDTYGFPIELTEELAREHNLEVDSEGFKTKFIEHQEKSRAGSKEKFKGGLSSSSDMNVKYHTTTHLLNAALKQTVNKDVHQKGSNITDERMRFDFSCDHKLTDEEIKNTEQLVNEWIQRGMDVEKFEMSKDDALKLGAEAMFIDKYGEFVTVYKISDISVELCGGPHVSNTALLGSFKIIKEEASSAGVRRIKAVLEDK